MSTDQFAVFPLYEPRADGSCACNRLGCDDAGKHPEYPFGSLGPGEKIRGVEGRNYGIATGVRSGIFVVDFDTIAAYEAMADRLPPTYSVATGRGVHLYYRHPGFPVRNSNSELAEKVDVKGDGGFVVAQGSRHKSGKTYDVIDDREPVDAPAWLLEWPNLRGREKTAKGVPSNAAKGVSSNAPIPCEGEELVRRERLFSAFLRTAPPCISGEVNAAGHKGQAQLWNVALEARKYELPPEVSARLIEEIYNPRCSPPWSETEIWHKVDDAWTKSKSTKPTGIAPEWFGKIESQPVEGAAPKDGRVLSAELRARLEANKMELVPPRAIELSSELYLNVREACEAIGDDHDVYQRAGHLVRLVRLSEADADAVHVAGTPSIRRMTAPTLKSRLTKVAIWQRNRLTKGADGSSSWRLVPAKPDDDIVSAVLHEGNWPTVRVLTGIAETPLLRSDGSILQTPGYDAATGYLYEPPAGGFPDVPDRPTHDDARAALVELLDVFADFPYANKVASVVPIAALLSIIARPAIRGPVPGFVFESSTRGSGKSLQADVISIIATGRDISRTSWPTSDEELDKVLNAYSREGASVLCFDNVAATAAFGGAPLDAVFTCTDTMRFRILGRTESEEHPWRAVVLATGNNISFRGDTARRVLLSRLEPAVENPESRTDFRYPDLRGWVRQERPTLVVAALTLLRAYFVAGAPAPVTPKGSFEAWSKIVPSAIAWAGGPDATTALPPEDADEGKDVLRTLLEAWPEGQTFFARELFDRSQESLIVATDKDLATRKAFRDALKGLGTLTSSKAMAGALRKHRGRVVGGKQLRSLDDAHAQQAKWFVEG